MIKIAKKVTSIAEEEYKNKMEKCDNLEVGRFRKSLVN